MHAPFCVSGSAMAVKGVPYRRVSVEHECIIIERIFLSKTIILQETQTFFLLLQLRQQLTMRWNTKTALPLLHNKLQTKFSREESSNKGNA